MVSHKVLEFGDNGYKLPAKARASRSVRKRRIYEKNISGDEKTCAIDLLATVAGSLLLESESSVNASEDNCVAVQNTVKKEFPAEENQHAKFSEDNPYQGSMNPSVDVQYGFSSRDHLLVGDKVENEVTGFSNLGVSDSCEVRNFIQDLKPGVDDEVKPDVVVSIGSNSSTEVGAGGNDGPHGSGDDVNLFSRDNDDDENFSGYICPRMTRTVPRIGDRRIRKILASRHWKGGSRNNADAKPWYCSKRNYYLHHHQRNYPIKKRKYFDNVSDSNFDDYHLQAKADKGSRTISSMKSRNASFVSRDHHVRLRIKSFRVPELFIEIPETATVGSLKRMVMEAVTTILGDGLRVGLMVQGKKVRDDSKTLLQTGISEENTHLDSLGFSLEPSLEPIPQPLLSSYLLEHARADLTLCRDNVLDSNHDSAPSLADDSRALVPISSAAVLAPQTPNRKCKRTEQQQAAHRRIRRPFSVTEVEALVQAVENLGTGRWRDVKVRAFEDADHRTYVDLKDKWKTLVHTARISPQQRRGEPVPQVLLDRVLKAHAYWSQHQMHQLKIEPPRFQAEALI